MRIDLSTRIPEASGDRKPARSKSSAGVSGGTGVAPDEVRLSLEHPRVQTLEAKVNGMPEIRSEKVEALRRATQDGAYKVGPEKIAEAIFEELLAPSTRIR